VILLLVAIQAASIESTPYWTCLDKQAARLERTGERPRDVALATLDLCNEASAKFATDHGYGLTLMMKIHDRLIDKVTARVVELRAKRKGL
jgi:hypothetical protein